MHREELRSRGRGRLHHLCGDIPASTVEQHAEPRGSLGVIVAGIVPEAVGMGEDRDQSYSRSRRRRRPGNPDARSQDAMRP